MIKYIFLGLSIVVLIINYIIIRIYLYNINHFRAKHGRKKTNQGNWYGGQYFANPLFYISIDENLSSDKESLKKLISKYNFALKFFYIFLIISIPLSIILFNLKL